MLNKMLEKSVKWLILPLFLFGAGCSSNNATVNNLNTGLSNENQSQKIAAVEYFENSKLQEVIRDYFNKIDLHKYSIAYDYLSEYFKAEHPLSEWSAGYEGTLGHAISNIQCDKNECIVDLVATEIKDGVIQKQNYVINYAFVKGKTGEPLINTGNLQSNKVIEVVKSKKITDEVLKNLSYPSGSFVPTPFHLVGGTQKLFDEQGNEAGYATLDSSIAHGDVNGDGYEDAVVSIRVNTGGTGVWPLVYLVINKDGVPTPYLLDNPQLEDRDLINSISILGNKVTFNLTVHSLSDPGCCPTMEKIENYKVVNNQLFKITPVQPTSPNGTYTNTYGNEVPSPYQAPSRPAGATAQCRDGSYSFSQSRSGTCSHHGGVMTWF